MESKSVVKLHLNCVVLAIHESVVALYRILVWHLDTPTRGSIVSPCPFMRVILGSTGLPEMAIMLCLMPIC